MFHYKQIELAGKSRYNARYLATEGVVACSDLKVQKSRIEFEAESRGKG